jgi:hypothetical protein
MSSNPDMDEILASLDGKCGDETYWN